MTRHVLWVLAFVIWCAGCERAPLNPGNIPDPALALREMIAAQQHRAVHESWGEQLGQNFTWIEYENFVRAGQAEAIVRALKKERRFLETVLRLQQLTADERRSVLQAVCVPLRRTWAQNGRVDRTGTTEAGQLAERLVAQAITRVAEELIERTPAEEIQRAWRSR